MTSTEHKRLLELKELISKKEASRKDQEEFMFILYSNGNINKEQYLNFMNNENSDNIINAALLIGGVVLTTWLISKLLDS